MNTVEQTPSPAPESAGPSMPVTAEHDGWTMQSASVGVRQEKTVTPESMLEEVREAEAPTGDDAAPAADPDAPPAEAAPATDKPAEPPKKKTAAERQAELQAQINALTRSRHELRRAVEAEEARLAKLKADQAAPAAPAASDDGPTWAAFEAEGKSWDEYATAWRAHVKAEALREGKAEAARLVDERLQQQQAQTAEQTALEAYRARLATVKATRPDFQDVVDAGLGDVPQTPFMTAFVMDHPKGPDVLYQLAQAPEVAHTLATISPSFTDVIWQVVKDETDPYPLLQYFAQHPDEVASLVAAPARTALLALGKLSARLSPLSPDGANASRTGTPSVAAVTRAPAPIRPVGGTRSSGGPPTNLVELPIEDYVREANRQEREQRRRLT